MTARTWNLKLTATEQYPETTIEGVPQADAAKILRGLIYGPGSRDYAHVEHAVTAARTLDRHEGSLAA
jgi:hypothetical protein